MVPDTKSYRVFRETGPEPFAAQDTLFLLLEHQGAEHQ